MESTFSKTNLLVGKHIIELNDGRVYLLVTTSSAGLAGLDIKGNLSTVGLENLQEDLTFADGVLRVDKVYQIPHMSIQGILEGLYRPIWDRDYGN